MEKRKILLPVALLALLISGCTVKKRSQTESNSQGSSTPQTSESSSSGGSQGGGSQGGTSESQGGTSQESTPTSEESQGGTSQESVPTGSGYFIKLGDGQPLEFVTEADLDSGVENELKNYHLQVNGVTAGEAIEFSSNAGVINHNIGPNDTCNADKTGSEEDGWSFTIHNDVVGNVDIYFKLYDYEDAVMRNEQPHSYSFWISGRAAHQVAYTVKVGDATPVAFEPTEKDAEPANELANYKATIAEGVAKDAALKFYADGEELNVGIGPNSGSNSVATYDETTHVGTFKIHNSVEGNVDIYLKTYDKENEDERDGQVHGYSFYVSGFAVNPEDQQDVTFKMTKELASDKALYVIGKFTNSWDVGSAIKLEKGEANLWSKTVKIEKGTYEGDNGYKFVIGPAEGELIPWKSETEQGNLEWEDLGTGVNRSLVVGSEPVVVEATWGSTSGGGEDPISAGDWYLVGTFNMVGESEWVLGDENYKLELHEDKMEGADQYVIRNVLLHSTDDFKFLKGDTWVDAEQYPSDSNNCKVSADGVYDIYFVPSKDVTQWSNARFYADKTCDRYSVVGKMGTEDFNADHDMTLNEGRAVLENLTLAAGDLLKVRVNHDWGTTFGWSNLNPKSAAFKEGEANGNIEVVTGGTYDVVLLVADSRLIIKEHGAADPDPEVLANYQLTVAIAAEFQGDGEGKYGNGGAITFIYAFNATENEWINAQSGSVEIPAKYTKIIVVRMNPANVSNPSWDGKWNQTEDIVIDNGKTTVTITGWGGETLAYTYA